MNDLTQPIQSLLVSRFQIGERCLFQPNLNKIDGSTGNAADPQSAVECEIAEVTFTSGKVYYGIKVRYQELGDEMWIPMGRIQSDFICPLEAQS